MAETCDPTIEDKLRNRGVSMVRLGRHDYKTVQDLAQQVVKFVVASLNSRCSPTKGRSVLVAGVECSPSNHDLLITGLGPACERNTLNRLIIEQLKNTIFVKSHCDRARESRYPFTNLTPHQVIVKLPCSESGCNRGRERNAEQQQCHVLVVSACPVLSLCTDKLFMVRCRESEEFRWVMIPYVTYQNTK